VGERRDAVARVLAIDPGLKRVGLAVSDPLGVTAQGLDTFEVGGGKELIDHLRELVARYDVETVVVGLPLSMRGGEIEGSERSRELAGRIREQLGIGVVLRDERMTSLEAQKTLARGDRRSDKGDIDRLAAVLLLQCYLEEVSGR
jgi:putative pre-16S rRNA nuclease